MPFIESIYMASKYTEKQVVEAVNASASIAKALIHLGLKPRGGNYKTFNNLVLKYKVDTSHFTGQGWCLGEKANYLRERRLISIEEILSGEKSYVSSHKLKLRLLKEGFFEHRCYNCHNNTWIDQPIPLELEHINGNNTDNRLENLTLLCPNCHALTPTYRGKNAKKIME
jgi:5-methylcytosine-specific restriction endonuclease McrA